MNFFYKLWINYLGLKLKMNSKLLLTLIRVQARFRGLILRKKVKSMIIQSSDLKNTSNNRFTKTTEEKIVILFF